MTIHPNLIHSGLAREFGLTHLVLASDPRAYLLGKRVRFKRSCDWTRLGTLARDCTFTVREVQKDWLGRPAVRIYCDTITDEFGRCTDPDKLEIVS